MRALTLCAGLFALGLPTRALAQTQTQTQPSSSAVTVAPAVSAALRLDAYLARVAQSNLELAAQRFNLSVSDAEIAMARVFPDPVLTVGVMSVDVSRVGAQNAYGAALTVPVEFPTRRGARIHAATEARTGAQAELDDFIRDLRAQAALAFVNVLDAQLELETRRQTLQNLDRLVAINEQRLRAGDVGEVAVVQSRVEAGRFRSELATAEGEVRATTTELLRWLGRAEQPAFEVRGDLHVPVRQFDVEQLVAHAREVRPDVRARRADIRTADARVDLAHANRGVDVAFGLGWQYLTPGANGSAFQAPSYHTLALTMSVPIPISRVYNGEVDRAVAERGQARAALDATSLRVDVEVRAAYARYDASVKRLNEFTTSLLADAQRVLDATLYTYQRGGGTLLEVLNAQRTANELYLSYADALAGHVRALIELERAAGMWDLAL